MVRREMQPEEQAPAVTTTTEPCAIAQDNPGPDVSILDADFSAEETNKKGGDE